MLIFEPKQYIDPIFPIIEAEQTVRVYNYFTREVLYVYRCSHNHLDIYDDHILSNYIDSCPDNGIVNSVYPKVWKLTDTRFLKYTVMRCSNNQKLARIIC